MKIVIVSMDYLSNTRKILIMVLVVYFQEKHEFSNKFPHKHYGFFLIYRKTDIRYSNTITNLRKDIVKYKMSN